MATSKRSMGRSCPPGLVGPFFHGTTEARARSILKHGFTLDTFGERTGKGKGLPTVFGRQKATPIFGKGIYVGTTREVAERYAAVVLEVYLRPGARVLDTEWVKMTGRRGSAGDPGVRAREPRWWQEFLDFAAEDARTRGGQFFQGYSMIEQLERRLGRPVDAETMRRFFDENAVLPWVVGNQMLPLDWDSLVSMAERLARARGYAAVEWDNELTIVDLSAIACVERARAPEPEPMPSNVIPFRRPGQASGRASGAGRKTSGAARAYRVEVYHSSAPEEPYDLGIAHLHPEAFQSGEALIEALYGAFDRRKIMRDLGPLQVERHGRQIVIVQPRKRHAVWHYAVLTPVR